MLFLCCAAAKPLSPFRSHQFGACRDMPRTRVARPAVWRRSIVYALRKCHVPLRLKNAGLCLTLYNLCKYTFYIYISRKLVSGSMNWRARQKSATKNRLRLLLQMEQAIPLYYLTEHKWSIKNQFWPSSCKTCPLKPLIPLSFTLWHMKNDRVW